MIVTDDGSTDGTLEMLDQLKAKVSYRLLWTTHTHDGFQLSRCRNEGVARGVAPYLLFSDGDCIFPRDHLEWHLRLRKRNQALCGDSWRLSREISDAIELNDIRSGRFAERVPHSERQRLLKKVRHAQIYRLLRLRTLPRLTGCNFSLWRDDFEAVNGFDEGYVGWGYEDRDLQFRLSRIGIRFRSILHRTSVAHLWHPVDPTFVAKGLGTENRRRFESGGLPIYCRLGLDRHLESAVVPVMRPSSPCVDLRKRAA